jgi:hypothetical protein
LDFNVGDASLDSDYKGDDQKHKEGKEMDTLDVKKHLDTKKSGFSFTKNLVKRLFRFHEKKSMITEQNSDPNLFIRKVYILYFLHTVLLLSFNLGVSISEKAREQWKDQLPLGITAIIIAFLISLITFLKRDWVKSRTIAAPLVVIQSTCLAVCAAWA